ncbi:hypothetical protein OIU77_002489 [Salix suchowensis]|uniref:Uncharacterized protein n=1 Tax=Salix suchowensis TaxID=1278906 RepID=A0ABQ9AZC8_9ROSI|nr:hypothetical protein OIU77_002489 [Salix suchowensis]
MIIFQLSCSIFISLVSSEEKHIETSDDLIRHMQEQFKEQARKSENLGCAPYWALQCGQGDNPFDLNSTDDCFHG